MIAEIARLLNINSNLAGHKFTWRD